MDALTEIGGIPLELLPYSSDIAPCGFWAFPTMKRELQYPPEAFGKRSAARFQEVGRAF
jgi:hypothetical protein